MARDAVVQERGSAWLSGPGERQELPRDVVGALAMLGDPEREVVVLRLLLGHSLAHTAHLSGYSHRAVLELQLAGCLAIWDLTGGARSGSGGARDGAPASAPPAEAFEQRPRGAAHHRAQADHDQLDRGRPDGGAPADQADHHPGTHHPGGSDHRRPDHDDRPHHDLGRAA